MTIQIEEGKFYRRRDGQRVGPLRYDKEPGGGPGASDHWTDGNHWYYRDGHWLINEEHHLDLVAEAKIDLFGPSPSEKPDVKAEIADEAKRIVSGARRAAYGTPESNFERIARFWQAYLENTGRGDAKITAADVSPMMRLMKEARLCETPDHRDSFVDLVGYTLTGAEVNGVQPLTPDKPQA